MPAVAPLAATLFVDAHRFTVVVPHIPRDMSVCDITDGQGASSEVSSEPVVGDPESGEGVIIPRLEEESVAAAVQPVAVNRDI